LSLKKLFSPFKIETAAKEAITNDFDLFEDETAFSPGILAN